MNTFLAYLDANNLYGWSMDQMLPIDSFTWLKKSTYKNFDWKRIKTESTYGFILEVDLEYPDSLHDLHKDYPLAPHRVKITNEELSDYQQKTIEYLKQFGYKRIPTTKLMQTLYNKYKYVIHFKNLKLYLNLGMNLLKIHRVLRFRQSKFLSKYIELNTNLRKNAKNDFEKDLFKLMNNSVFGKSIQSQRKHLDIKIGLTEKQTSKLLVKPNFESFTILDNDKALIKMRKTTVKLNRPIYIGFTVLELSKYLMYKYYYNIFKSYYADDISLCYTDTDSFLFEIHTENLYKDFGNVFKKYFDFSNYPIDHELYDTSKQKQIGYFKDEYASKIVDEFIALKSKLYSIKYEDTKNKTVAKGLQKSILKKFINHNHYKNVLLNNNVFTTTVRRIRSKNQELQTVKQKKMIFTPFDDKKYYLDDGIHCLPFGHFSLRK